MAAPTDAVNQSGDAAQNMEEIKQNLARSLNLIQDPNRNTRKRGLVSIRQETTARKSSPHNAETLQLILTHVEKPLLKCLFDPVEKNRDLCLTLIDEFVDGVPDPSELLPYLLPAAVQRLGQLEMAEPSEEMRLSFVQLVRKLIEICGRKIGPYLDDLVKIFSRTIVDPYPEVKRSSCDAAALLAATLQPIFHLQSEGLVKPLLQTITHQHYKVRCAAIHSLGAVVKFGNNKSVDDVMAPLAQRLFDQTPMVRLAVTELAADWLVSLPDRYSYFHRCIPLLLTSTQDEIPDISTKARALWEVAGALYQTENSEELKDKLDFAGIDPQFYPESETRPCLGCRVLVQRNQFKILPALCRDLADWTAATRHKSACLLYTMVLNAEDLITQHIDTVLTALYRACMDDDPQVVSQVLRTAELVGVFINADVSCKLILTAVNTHQNHGPLRVLAAVIRGSRGGRSFLGQLSDIVEVVSRPDICRSAQVEYQLEVLNMVDAIVSTCPSECGVHAPSLFAVAISVVSLASEASVVEKTESCLAGLCTALSCDMESLFVSYAPSLLTLLADGSDSWTHCSSEIRIFQTLILKSGGAAGHNLDVIVPILTSNLRPEKDPELRLAFLTLLCRLFGSCSETINSTGAFSAHIAVVLREIVLPNLVWKAGRTSAAIRIAVVSCLWALIQSELLTQQQCTEELTTDVLTHLVPCLDEDSKTTRLISVRVMDRLLTLCPLHVDTLHKIYPELLKRMDDSQDDIRLKVTETFTTFFRSLPTEYDTCLYGAHLETLYRGLLVHLDDPNTDIQQSVHNLLTDAARVGPKHLQKEIDQVKHKHRTQGFCDQLLNHINTLSLDS